MTPEDGVTRRVLAVLASMGKTDVPLDVDLVSSGILDSLDFLELVESLEAEFDVELDFSGLDPERFTTLIGLVDAVQGDLGARREADATTSEPSAPERAVDASGCRPAR